MDEVNQYVLTPKCACCGKEEEYVCNEEESETLDTYMVLGRQMGKLQELFPNIPDWIRAGCIDMASDGFCVCPDCSPFKE